MAFTLAQLQQVILNLYDAKDRRRGVEGTFMWFMQEVGELATALRSGSQEELALELFERERRQSRPCDGALHRRERGIGLLRCLAELAFHHPRLSRLDMANGLHHGVRMPDE